MQKLMKLASHEARGDVVSTEGLPELDPWNLVAVAKSGSVVSPPSTGRPMKLLGHIQSLLKLGTVQVPKLGLSDAKPIIHLKRIRRLGERRRVSHQDVSVGGVQHRLVMWLAASSMHDVLHQHPHELVLRG
jgi:hypothetical protein